MASKGAIQQMLIRAHYEGDKIKTLHAERIDESASYCKELAKDESNGFTEDRSMRRVCSPPMLTLLADDKEHPGWLNSAMNSRDPIEKNRLWKEFLKSDYAKPFMTVDKLYHG